MTQEQQTFVNQRLSMMVLGAKAAAKDHKHTLDTWRYNADNDAETFCVNCLARVSLLIAEDGVQWGIDTAVTMVCLNPEKKESET
jgi:hypothetical protein